MPAIISAFSVGAEVWNQASTSARAQSFRTLRFPFLSFQVPVTEVMYPVAFAQFCQQLCGHPLPPSHSKRQRLGWKHWSEKAGIPSKILAHHHRVDWLNCCHLPFACVFVGAIIHNPAGQSVLAFFEGRNNQILHGQFVFSRLPCLFVCLFVCSRILAR